MEMTGDRSRGKTETSFNGAFWYSMYGSVAEQWESDHCFDHIGNAVGGLQASGECAASDYFTGEATYLAYEYDCCCDQEYESMNGNSYWYRHCWRFSSSVPFYVTWDVIAGALRQQNVACRELRDQSQDTIFLPSGDWDSVQRVYQGRPLEIGGERIELLNLKWLVEALTGFSTDEAAG